MTKTEIERLVVIETKFETVIEPMALKVDQIHDGFKEVKRKVDKHHEVFQEHSEMLNKLEEAQCPAAKVMPEKRSPDGNGGYIERRTKESLWKQYTKLPLSKRLSILVIGLPFIGGYWNWILETAHKILDWLQLVT